MEVLGTYWLDLPLEILSLIAGKIEDYKDLIVFGSVGKTWHLTSTFVKHPEAPPKFPLLVLSDTFGTTYEEEQTHILRKRTLFDIYSFTSFDINLPEAYGKKCYPVNYGWLFTLSRKGEIELLHPFTRRLIKLPDARSFSTPLEHPRDYRYNERNFPFVKKVVISCPPPNHRQGSSECTVFIICGETRNLAFTRIGDDCWTAVNLNKPYLHDIVYKNGQLYALDVHRVVVYRFERGIIIVEDPKVIARTPDFPCTSGDPYRKDYLLLSGDDLLLVQRLSVKKHHGNFERRRDVELFTTSARAETLPYFKTYFAIYRLKKKREANVTQYPLKWTKVKSLGNQALFLGNTSSLYVPATFIKGNCIYFTDNNNIPSYCQDSDNVGYGMGIYDVQDKTIVRHYTGRSGSMYRHHFWYI